MASAFNRTRKDTTNGTQLKEQCFAWAEDVEGERNAAALFARAKYNALNARR